MSDNQMPATASVPPRSSARNATGTRSPAGANKIAPSRDSGGASRRRPLNQRQLGGQLLVGLAPSQDVDAQALRQRHLCGQMRAAAETVDAERAAGWYRRTDQCPVADDASAQQRGQVLVVNACGKRVRKGLVDEAEVCVAAITVPAGERRRKAEVLRAAPTESATAVRAAEPGHADAVIDSKPGCAVAKGIDNADNLVTRGDVGMLGGKSLCEVQIGTADAAAGDLDATWLASGVGTLRSTRCNGSFSIGPGCDGPSVHLAILTSRRGRGNRRWIPIFKPRPSSGT